MSINSGILVPPGGGGIIINGTTIETITVNNALEFDGVSETLQFGGDLVKNTEIDVQTFGLTIKDEGNDLIKFGVTDGAIDVITTAFSFDPTAYGITGNEILGVTAGGIVTPATVENGLSFDVTGSDKVLKLGGTLTENTTIDGASGSYAFNLNNFSTLTFNTQPSGATTNEQIIFNISANSALQRNRISIIDNSGSSNTIAELLLVKVSKTVSLQINDNSHVGIINGTSNVFRNALIATNSQHILGFHHNSAATNRNVYFSLSAGTSTRLDNFSLIFGSLIQGPSALDATTWGTPTTLARFHSRGTWSYVNRTAAPPVTLSNSFDMYAANVTAGGDSAPHFITEDNNTIILYPFGQYNAPTGNQARQSFDPSTVTLEELAETVAALITDIGSTGLIKVV